ncbi:MAG: DUF255 domain-containing protein [Chitinophagia bacterium]|nr:DUF255 domain-containing protein [Chitinophagia bacterium]
MKRYILIAAALFSLCSTAFAERKMPPKEEGIHWLTLDELQVKMKQEPKKVYMDMYTDWCGWCKRMEATTFSNADVINYMNANFYCVRFNAERRDTFRFLGTQYYFDPEKRVNTLAFNLLGGKLSYPTSVIMEERYQNPQPIPGYLDVNQMELILRFFGDNVYKKTQFPDYQKNFKATWNAGTTATPPPTGH